MSRSTGVQVTGTVVRVVEIDGSAKKFKIRGFAEAPIVAEDAGDRTQAMAKAFKEAFKASKAGRDHVVIGIPIRDCIVREIVVPFTQIDQIRKVVKFESESHLHSCTIDEVVICFHKVEDLGNRSAIQIFAAKKDVIRDILIALERAGVDPLAVDIDVAGLFGIWQCLAPSEHVGAEVICDIGYTSTMIMLVRDGNLRLVRSVRMGTDSLSARVSKDLDLSPAEARTRTQQIITQELQLDDDLLVRSGDVSSGATETSKTSNELERDIIRQRQSELTKRIEQEIFRSIAPANLSEPLKTVWILGPGSNLPRMREELAERMQLPVKGLGLLEKMDHDFKGAQAGIYEAVAPMACGLAAKQLGLDPLQLDFRQEEFVFAKKFDRLKVPLLCLVVLMTSLNALWWLFETKVRKEQLAILNGIAQASANDFTAVMQTNDPKILGILPVDKKELDSLYAGASADKSPMERLSYMTSTVSSLDGKLLKKFGLSRSKRSRRSSSASSTRNIPTDPSGFRSALDMLEWVCKSVHDLKVKEIAFNRLSIQPNEVQFALTLPQKVDYEGGISKTHIDLLAALKDNLKSLAGDQFENLEDIGAQTVNKENRGMDVVLRASFVRQDM